MEIDDIRAFVAVARAGSISAAARELFRTQPAVTRRLQRLEDALGARLVDRRRRPFALTPAGQAALARCLELLASVQELRSVAATGRELGGELRVEVAQALSELTMEEPVAEVQRRFPQVVFRLGTGLCRDLLERVRSHAVDAAFVLLPVREEPPAGVRSTAIAEERMVVVAPRSEPATTVPLAALGGRSWVLNPDGCAARDTLGHAMVRAGHTLRVGIETYDYELQLSLVAQGRGLGLVPSRLLARSRFQDQVQRVDVREFEFEMKIWSLLGRPAVSLEPVLEELTRAVGRSLNSV